MADLDGTSVPVDLGLGVSLVAPGLTGTAERQEQLFGGRADEEPLASEALTAALERAGMEQVHGVQIDAQEVPVAGLDVRGPDDEGLLLLRVPDLGPESTQVLLVVDEAGVATWHTAEPAGPEALGSVEFAVRRDVATDAVDGSIEPGQRGVAAVIGKKLLSVLLVPLAEAGVRILARELAERYERASRPTRLRRFVPGNTTRAGADDLAGGGWDAVGDGRVLLFVHGTFSTSHGGFGGLHDDTLASLWNRYGHRVLAFDHPTLSATPAENVAALLALLPTGRRLEVDIVSHSRGGLVARALADAAAEPGSPLTIGSTVFVGTPNLGTQLADDAHIKAFVNRMTTMLNLVPDGPWSVVTDVLAGVLDVVKILAAGAVGGLPGLRAMNPNDSTLTTLGGQADPATARYAVSADYEPSGALLQLVRIADTAVDRVFGSVPNDIVVPTDVATGPEGLAGFPIPDAHRLAFGRTRDVWHCSYFSHTRTNAALLDWCRGDPKA